MSLDRRWVAVLSVCVVAVLAACASAGTPKNVQRRDNNRMDTTEFRRPEFRTLYDAIKSLRPDWLVPKGGVTSIHAPVEPVVGVFIEGQSSGFPISKLLEFVGGDVKSVRRISPGESLAYGPGWPWGGIVITRAR